MTLEPARQEPRPSALDDAVERLLPWVAASSGAVVTLCVAGRILVAPQWDWNAARLWFSFVLARGFDLYPLPGSQPVPGCIYGPVSAVAYLPAVVFGSSTIAVVVGAFLSVLYAVGPASWFLHAWSPGNRDRWLGLVVFTGTCLVSGPLRYSTFSIHADAPMLGLLTLAVGSWWTAARRQGSPLFAAFMVAAAVWCKQNVLPVVLVFPLWSLLVSGPRAALRGLVSIGIAFAVVSVAAVSSFGFSDLVFNLVTLPAATPWYGSGTRVERLVPVLRDFARLASIWSVGLAALIALHWRAAGATRRTWRPWLQDRPWMLVLLAGAFLAPISILARARMGGGVNSWTPTLYFLVLACLVALLGLIHTPAQRKGGAGVARLARALLLIWAAWIGVREVSGPDMEALWRDEVRHPFKNPQQQAQDHLAAHPGSTYLPWNPLAHLMAESRLVHYADGVIIRDLAGLPLSQAEFDAGVGRTFVFVASAPGRRNERVQRRYLSRFSERVELPGLPGWTVYQIPSSTDR